MTNSQFPLGLFTGHPPDGKMSPEKVPILSYHYYVIFAQKEKWREDIPEVISTRYRFLKVLLITCVHEKVNCIQ